MIEEFWFFKGIEGYLGCISYFIRVVCIVGVIWVVRFFELLEGIWVFSLMCYDCVI